MAIAPHLLNRLREYSAAAYAGRALPVAEIRKELATIPNEAVREGALSRFHIVLVCATVMKSDPMNFQRAVKKACESLIRYLEEASAPAAASGQLTKVS